MELTLTTPAYFFPAIALLFLAFINRHSALSKRIRYLHLEYKNSKEDVLAKQIVNLRTRIHLVRNMELLAIASMLLNVVTILFLFLSNIGVAKIMFTLGMLALVAALCVSIAEILMSLHALNVLLDDTE